MGAKKTTDGANVAGESDRSIGERLVLWVLGALSSTSPLDALEEAGDRLARPTKALLVSAFAVVVASNPTAAADAGENFCDDGVGLLVADTQLMLWQIVLGMLVIVALVGLVLRSFPLFSGATAMGNLMIVGVIVGVVGFVFILTFIEFAFSAVGGPGIGQGCSPFL